MYIGPGSVPLITGATVNKALSERHTSSIAASSSHIFFRPNDRPNDAGVCIAYHGFAVELLWPLSIGERPGSMYALLRWPLEGCRNSDTFAPPSADTPVRPWCEDEGGWSCDALSAVNPEQL
jgi:hypothetical protein